MGCLLLAGLLPFSVNATEQKDQSMPALGITQKSPCSSLVAYMKSGIKFSAFDKSMNSIFLVNLMASADPDRFSTHQPSLVQFKEYEIGLMRLCISSPDVPLSEAMAGSIAAVDLSSPR